MTTRYAIGIQLWHYRCRATLKIPHHLIGNLALHFPLSLLVLIFREKVYEFLAKTNKHKTEKYLTIYNFSLYAGYQIFVSVHSSVSLEKMFDSGLVIMFGSTSSRLLFLQVYSATELLCFLFQPLDSCTLDFFKFEHL